MRRWFWVTLCLAAGAVAGGLRQVDVPKLAPAPAGLVVDGRLDEWQAVAAQTFRPVDASQSQTTGTLVADLQAHPREVSWRLAYDAQALYLALDWTTPTAPRNSTPPDQPDTWADGGDGLELHLAGERTLHLACWPAADGPVLRLRHGEQRDWQPAPSAHAALALTPRGYSQELSLPWALLNDDGALPAGGRLDLAVDFAWAALGRAELDALPLDLRRPFVHQTLSFLTAESRLFSQGYLPQPSLWGRLAFVAEPRRPALETSRTGTGLTDLSVRRAPTAPTIDGNLGDWAGVPFATAALSPELLGQRRAYALAAQYDDQALYLAGRGSTPKPLNLAREAAQNGYGGGDCLQVRLQLGTKVVNLCAWYDSTVGAPALTADGVDLAEPFLQRVGAREAFGSQDGGYTQEIAVPWAALGVAPPKLGERWRATFQPWWASLDSRFTLLASATLSRPDPLAVSYQMPADGELTLGLFDRAGALLRWLTRSEHRRQGANRDTWDGLDQWGQPVPAGDYTVRALWHPPLGLDYRQSLMNPGNPPWPTPDGRGDWLSDEAPPQAVATDGDWVWLAAPGCEKGFATIALNGRGERQWGVSEEFYPRCVSIALDGDDLFALYSGPELTEPGNRYNGKNAAERAVLICRDKRTGRPKRFSVEHPRLKIASWPYVERTVGLWDLRTRAGFTPAVYGGQPRYFAEDIGEPAGAIGLAVTRGKVWVSRIDLGRLLAYDAQTAAPAGEIALPEPAGLCALPDGRLLAVSGTRVARVDPATGAVEPIITTGLAAPHSLCLDSRGRIFVSDWGNAFQVKVFSADGRFERAVGRPGGRPWVGAWQPDGMLVPRGIGVTRAGELWVAEDDTLPKRVSVWNADTGAFVRDYLGPTPYGGGTLFAVDPKDATRAYSSGLELKLDPAAKTAKPVAITHRRLSRDQPFALNPHGCIVGGQKIVWRDGREYLVANGQNMLVFAVKRGDRFQPVAAMGSVQRYITDDGTGKQIWDSDIGYHMVRDWFPDCFRGHAGHLFNWADANDDGLVQPDEVRWTPTLTRGDAWVDGRLTEWLDSWGVGIGPDWSLYFTGFCRDRTAVWRVDPSGFAANGAPLYDAGSAKLLMSEPRHACLSGLYVNAENRLFVSYRYEGDQAKGNPDVLRCLDRDGRLLWRLAQPVGRGRDQVHGENVCGEFNLPGLGNVLGTWLWHGNYRPYLLTSDGLYVGTLQDDTKLGPAGLWNESYRYYYQQPDGTPMFVNGANQANHLLRITGLSGGRFELPLHLSEAEATAAGAARQAPVAAEAARPTLRVAWLAQPPTVDGELDDWVMDQGVRLDAGDGRGARVALGRDADSLYLAYRVRQPRGYANGGDNWQTPFISGDCVDLMLGPSAEPNRAEPVAGDLRLVLSRLSGQPQATLYRPVAPGAGDGAQLMAARFDSVRRLADAQVAIVPDGEAYTVEARVPLRSLGLELAAGGELRGDVGVIFADDTGRSRSLRLYYHNRNTGITADLTTEARLSPRDWGAVSLPLGANLLRNESFEEPLAAPPTRGWQQEFSQQGAAARLVEGVGHSGRRALLLEAAQPTLFPTAAYDLPDYDAFLKTANDGAGSGHVSVAQRVPVVAGHHYQLRIWYRAAGLVEEVKRPGHPRGYNAFGPWVYWPGAKQNGATWVANEQRNQPEWRVLLNAQANQWKLAVPYTAPEGSREAVIALKLTNNSADGRARVWVDDVEFVEVAE